MIYEKLLRLYNLPEDCFNLFQKNCNSTESSTATRNSSQDKTCVTETEIDQKSSAYFQENDVKSIETNISTEFASNLSRNEKADCNKCQFLVVDVTSPGENDYRCCFNNTYISSTEVQCDNFEQKAELPIEPEIDDYTG
jgi:hypothetical protein